MGNGRTLHEQTPPYKLLLKHHRAPGDTLVMTAAVGALKRQYGNRYRIKVDTTCMELWDNNPNVEQGLINSECHIIPLEYPLIQSAGKEPVHFMQAFCEDLSRHLKQTVRLDTNHPELFLSEKEKKSFTSRPYVVLNAGYKTDFTRKFAGSPIFQEIVDHFRGRLQFVQVGEANPSHIHKPLHGAVNLIGKTTTRRLIQLAYGSLLGVGPVSLLHHIYGALQKPYVCYIGGAEEVSWEGYNTATMLTTLGQLPCCATKACWKSRVVPLNDGQDKSLCSLPVVNSCGEHIPKCMELLGSGSAIKAIETILNHRA